MLRRIDPGGSSAGQFEGIDLETAWQQAAEDIVAEHNRRADPRAAQDAIGPRRASRSSCFRDPAVILPEGAERAAEALSVPRGTAVRRALNEIRAETLEERISRNEAVAQVVRLVEELGLQPTALDDFPAEITEDDLASFAGWLFFLPLFSVRRRR